MLHEDYHVHCLSSPVTDHYEMFHNEEKWPPYRREYLERCFRTMEECRERFEGQVFVGFGAELGQWQLQPEAAKRVVRDYPFDYVIGSLHKMDDVDLKYFRYREIDAGGLLRRYLEDLLAVARLGDFDCLGHLDLIKRYAAEQGVSIRAEEELVREILRTLIRRGKGLEINTSGLRQAVKETFPSRTILGWYLEEGGTILTVGSDAHRRQDVGAGFKEAKALALALGFTYISCFRERKLIQKKIE